MGATPREASNCSRKFGPPTAAQQFSYPQIFSSLAEVRRLADTVRQECDRLDVLINNAGIGSGGDRARSPRARKRAMIAPPVKKISAVTTGMVTNLTVTIVWASHNAITTAENLEGIRASGARVLDGRTANMIRTAPLWGLRVRPQLLHDGSALTTEEAILRHSVQAKDAKEAFERLSREDKQRLLIFLKSL
jgi:NAD(P)-dependent dehydrogenase (short-subunit alcohol dehydrogenase family)